MLVYLFAGYARIYPIWQAKGPGQLYLIQKFPLITLLRYKMEVICTSINGN